MPELTRPDGATIHYEIHGAGEPLLALAPGPVGGGIEDWRSAHIDPIGQLANAFQVIAVDVRHAGASRAPLAPFSWEQALSDHLAVLDAAGIASAHIVAEDVGAAAGLRLAYEAPARVRSAVLIQPVGLDATNRMDSYYARFNETIRVARAEGIEGVIDTALAGGSFATNPGAGPWAARLHDDATFRDTLRQFGRENYIALIVDFRDGIWPWQRRYFAVNEVSVSRLETPMLVVPGNDELHPAGLAAALAEAAPAARLGEVGDVADFLAAV